MKLPSMSVNKHVFCTNLRRSRLEINSIIDVFMVNKGGKNPF